ncbi:MAG: hypothetical protein LBR31_07200 [Desulfovibrio sp.]|nr:hypothetical protein [Desulfovibrio sp.]
MICQEVITGPTFMIAKNKENRFYDEIRNIEKIYRDDNNLTRQDKTLTKEEKNKRIALNVKEKALYMQDIQATRREIGCLYLTSILSFLSVLITILYFTIKK